MLMLISFFVITPLPTYPQELEKVIVSEKFDVREGEKMALAICKSCHYNPDLDRLSGIKHGNPGKFGDLYSSNITNDSVFGIGAWSNLELDYFLRTGVKRDGSFVFDMPKYNYLSNEDIASIIAFLRSDDHLVQAVSSQVGQTQYSILSQFLLKFFFRPEKYVSYIPPINKKDTLSWGKYLSTVKYSCANCHSGNSMTYNNRFPEKSWKYFKGGNPHYDEVNNKVITPSLRPISKYSRNDFIKILQTGYKKNGSMLKRPMIPFNMLDSLEINSIYSYLLTLDLNENRN